MGERRSETARHEIDALFRLGVVSGISDGQLLERIGTQPDSDGQLAFEAIVRRHGPMVLGVCLRTLGDYHSAEDAFQATFMVLAVKSRAIRKQDSLGPWLHGVALRIARRKVVVGRRGKGAAIPAEGLVGPVDHDPASADVSSVLDEELGRLPDKYRLPVVLCYLEGQTQEEAARTLGWTKGTVSGRLARAKDLLRHRLTRRGLAPTAGVLAACLTSPTARAAVPAALLRPTVRAGVAAVLGGAELGLVAGPAASLAREALKVMFLGRIGRVAAQVFALGLGAAALATPMLMPHATVPPRNFGGALIAPDRRVATTRRLDRFGDPLPLGVITRLGTIQRRHTSGVAGLDFTRDGKAAVTAQNDGIIRFWDAETGRQVRTFDLMADAPSQDKSLRDFAISPDGALMAGAGVVFDPVQRRMFQRLWIRDLKDDRPRRQIDVPAIDVFCMAFGPDGSRLATGGFAGEVRLFDVATGECLKTLKLGTAPVHSLSFTSDGKIIAVCEQQKGTRLFDLELAHETFLADERTTAIAPVFSPDGRWMAVNALGGEAVIWNRATHERHLTALGVAIAFAPDSRSLVMFGPDDRSLELVDTEVGSMIWKAELGAPAGTGGIAFSPDGKTIIAERGGALRFFESDSGRERFGSPETHQGGVNVVQYLPDGRTILTAADDGTVRQWDAKAAPQLRVFPHDGRVALLSVSADGASLAAAVQGHSASVTVWDLGTGARRRQWSETDGGSGTQALSFSSQGDTLLAFDQERGLRILDVATGEEREAEQPRFSLDQAGIVNPAVTQGLFSAGNQFLALATPTTVHVADLATGAVRLEAPGEALAFTANGQGLLIAAPGPPAMIPLADGSYRTSGPFADRVDLVDLGMLSKRTIDIQREPVTALAISPDGKLVAVAGGWPKPMVRLYRTADGREMRTYSGLARVNQPGGLAFAPDGRSLAAGQGDTTVVIWDTSDVR